jgi:hypothetical protein
MGPTLSRIKPLCVNIRIKSHLKGANPGRLPEKSYLWVSESKFWVSEFEFDDELGCLNLKMSLQGV